VRKSKLINSPTTSAMTELASTLLNQEDCNKNTLKLFLLVHSLHCVHAAEIISRKIQVMRIT
jgi:predicted transposase YbfD/YdcC